MRHRWSISANDGGEVRYGWTHDGNDFELGARVSGPAAPLVTGSEAEFITEHYWGYTRQRDGATLEYQVEHPRWRVWTATANWFSGLGASLYGPEFGAVLSGTPCSGFVAVGSPVTVHRGRRIVQ